MKNSLVVNVVEFCDQTLTQRGDKTKAERYLFMEQNEAAP
jgi:hypothetical protein